MPHIFACQEAGKQTCPPAEGIDVVKRTRQNIIQYVFVEASTLKSNLPIQQEVSPEVLHIEENMDIKLNKHVFSATFNQLKGVQAFYPLSRQLLVLLYPQLSCQV